MNLDLTQVFTDIFIDFYLLPQYSQWREREITSIDLSQYFSSTQSRKNDKEEQTTTKHKTLKKLDNEAKSKRGFVVSWTKEHVFCPVCHQLPTIYDSTSPFVIGIDQSYKCIGAQSEASFPEQMPKSSSPTQSPELLHDTTQSYHRHSYSVDTIYYHVFSIK